MKHIRNVTCALLLATLAAPGAYADKPLRSTMSAFVVEVEDGDERLVQASSAAPDDVIEYQIEYRNEGTSTVQGLAVTGPVPANTHYLAATAASAASHQLLVSIDDGVTFEAEPVIRQELDADGVARQVVVAASEYTHVHWQLTELMPAAEARTFSYRVRVR